MQVYGVEIDDDEVLMWWEEFEHDNLALKVKYNVQIGDFFLLHEHCNPFTNRFLCFSTMDHHLIIKTCGS